MDRSALAAAIADIFPELPAQLGRAARYILDNPDDVALLSMREQARRAGVRPWTMTRLAQRLGQDGYDDIRAMHAQAIREAGPGFHRRAGAQVSRQRESGDRVLAREIVDTIGRQIDRLGDSGTLDRLEQAAGLMAGARRIFCLGLRSSHGVAAQFAYVMSFLDDRAVMVGGDGRTGMDALRFATPADVLFVVSVAPYTRDTVQAARFAAEGGVPLVVVTDSEVSPLASIAKVSVLVSTESPSFFHAMTPAFLVAEVLAALLAGRAGNAALDAISRAEQQFAAFGTHLETTSTRSRP